MSEQGFYLVAQSLEADGGVRHYRIAASGRPEEAGFTAVPRCNFLNWSIDRRTVYASCVTGGKGGVTALRVGPDGALSELNTLSADGMATCYTVAAPGGKFIYAANYSSSTFAEFALRADGSLDRLTRLVGHEGRGVNPQRQEKAHPHFTNFTPDGRYLIVIDLGIDSVKCYPFDPEKGIDPAGVRTTVIAPAGVGPRHLVFDRSGRIAYLMNELDSSVTALRYGDGRFEQLGTVTALPRFFTGATKAAAIRLSPDERFLFASNRGFDSIAVFRLDGEGGMTPHDLVLSGGVSPRDINFLPGGKMFAAANEETDNVVFFDYDAETGKLTPNGLEIKLTHPLFIFW